MRKATALVFVIPVLVTVGVGLAFYRPTSCSAVCKSGKDQLTAIHLPKNCSVSEKLGFGAATATDPWDNWSEEFRVRGTPKEAIGQFDAAAKAAGWQVEPRCDVQQFRVTGCWRKPSAGYRLNAEASSLSGWGVLVAIRMFEDHAVR